MKPNQFTPGPMRVNRLAERRSSDGQLLAMRRLLVGTNAPHGKTSLTIAELFWDIPTAEANATLFAAAPELMAALKMCVSLMDDPPEMMRSNETDAYRHARAAIAKAQGSGVGE